MSDVAEIASIGAMSEQELLDYVVLNGELLTDGYYRQFRLAIMKRYDQLVAKRPVKS